MLYRATTAPSLPYTTSEAASHPCHVSPGLGDLAVAVLVHDEGGGLAGGVDDERVAVEALQHDGVLHTQVVCRQTVRLPQQTLVWVRQVLKRHDTYVRFCYVDVCLFDKIVNTGDRPLLSVEVLFPYPCIIVQ